MLRSVGEMIAMDASVLPKHRKHYSPKKLLTKAMAERQPTSGLSGSSWPMSNFYPLGHLGHSHSIVNGTRRVVLKVLSRLLSKALDLEQTNFDNYPHRSPIMQCELDPANGTEIATNGSESMCSHHNRPFHHQPRCSGSGSVLFCPIA
ncbi:hypothetical protein M409DRAFT_51050 [Zasmidium cellare ATCC 36951]|uniref:Uncharacterized protein n=1 Tax=Zasmidium cellare ATCC 36951 TaxID=1080233 RepID=A0A6A6CUF4_ZASCE|nr:uncharacterized protein M409DRAFT_51050 [Zasmidium cellare ATCC 36951]KAF2170794.1 hypothetical protein M409DRAFT_51050 [Zasmidium cellare ATCC 36951]